MHREKRNGSVFKFKRFLISEIKYIHCSCAYVKDSKIHRFMIFLLFILVVVSSFVLWFEHLTSFPRISLFARHTFFFSSIKTIRYHKLLFIWCLVYTMTAHMCNGMKIIDFFLFLFCIIYASIVSILFLFFCYVNTKYVVHAHFRQYCCTFCYTFTLNGKPKKDMKEIR